MRVPRVPVKSVIRTASLIAILTFLSPAQISTLAHSADTIVIQDSTTYTANIASVGNIWSGNIPKNIQFPLGNYSQKIEFPIQGLLPISVLSDRATGTRVEIELWATTGKKIAYDIVSSSDWNPVGPNTLVSMYLSESDAIGSHTLIVRTIYELKTNGLLTSYLKQEDRFPVLITSMKKSQTISVGTLKNRSISEGSFTLYSFDVKSSEYSLKVLTSSITPATCLANGDTINLVGAGTCTLSFSQSGNDTIAPASPVQSSFQIAGSKPSQVTNLTATLAGQSIDYSFTKPVSSSPIISYEVTIQHLLRSGLPVTQYLSYGPYTVIKKINSENFSITSDEIKNYLLSDGVQDVSKESVMVRVIANNDLGASEMSTGIYTETTRFGWKTSPVTKKITISCTKGTLTKKVTSTNPKCPAGYKVKK